MPANPIDALLAERVEKATIAVGAVPPGDPNHVQAVWLAACGEQEAALEAAGLPALLGALARAYDVLCNEDNAADAATEASVILLAALDGERPAGGSDASELEAKNRRMALSEMRAAEEDLRLAGEVESAATLRSWLDRLASESTTTTEGDTDIRGDANWSYPTNEGDSDGR